MSSSFSGTLRHYAHALCTLLRVYPLRSTEYRGTHVSPRVTRACTRVARARSKPVGRLAGTGDENLASASRCRPPDSRSKLSLYPAALTLRARFTPQLSPWPSFSLAARSHTPRAHRAFLDETFPARRDTPLSTTTSLPSSPLPSPSPMDAVVPATTTTIRRDHLRRFHVLPVATRRCVAYGASPPNFPLLSRSEPLFLPHFPPFIPIPSPRPRRACHPFLRVYPVRASFSASPSSFVQLFPPNPTAARVDDDATAT